MLSCLDPTVGRLSRVGRSVKPRKGRVLCGLGNKKGPKHSQKVALDTWNIDRSSKEPIEVVWTSDKVRCFRYVQLVRNPSSKWINGYMDRWRCEMIQSKSSQASQSTEAAVVLSDS